MNINGINENSRTKSQEKIYNGVVKETQNTAAENQSHKISSVMNIEPVTYEDEVLKVNDKIKNEQIQTSSEEELWENIIGRLTNEDYEELSKEGISLEEYNSERLDRALVRIKKQRIQKEDSLLNQKEYIKDKNEAIQKMADYDKGTKKIVEKLIESDLPVTEENIIKLQNAIEMATAAMPVSDKAKTYLIKNNQDPTIENIYKASYSGKYSKSKEISEETWNGLIDQVKEILSNSGFEINKENLESAKWLLNQNLPLTEETLWSLCELNTMNVTIEENKILEKAVEALVNGVSADSASLGSSVIDRANQSILAFHRISDEAVDVAVNSYQGQGELIDQINLQELRKAQRQIDSGLYNPVENQKPQNIDIHTITVRRQLEEIRLKMTVEAGSQLVKSGINPNTDSLRKIVDGLRELENQYYHNLLKESNANDNVQNTQTLKISLESLEVLKRLPSYVLGSTLNNRSLVTVNGLLEAGTECKRNLEQAKEAYETLMTTPRKDMGDSITKAFRNVDAILEDMKLEITKANERAVRILGYNQIELTEENIQQVKVYDEQVNHLIKNLHPAVAVELIKNGINPIDTPIKELNARIDAVKNELGVSGEEKYSKYLWKLEKEKSITEEEKKSFIGIYRLLHTVESTDGAALGAVIKANQEVTMNHLLTAVRTLKSGGIRANVDDSFGALEQFTYSGERITDQIQAAFSNEGQTSGGNTSDSGVGEKLEYMNRLLQNVMDEITPAKLQGMGKTEDIWNLSMEKLQERLQEVPDNEEVEQEYWAQKTEVYKQTIEQSNMALKLLKDYEIPSSIHNIQAANELLSMDQTVFNQLKNLLKNKGTGQAITAKEEDGKGAWEISNISDDLVDSIIDQESLLSQFEKVEKEVNSQLNSLYENEKITSQDIVALQHISNGLSFLKQLAKRESYEIPIAVGDMITNINVTIVRNIGETGKVDISVQSDTFGKISAVLSVKDKEVKGLITCNNRFGLETVQSENDSLKETISKAGLTVKQINYGIESIAADNYRAKLRNKVTAEESKSPAEGQTVTTNTLYNIAKAMVVQIRALETKYMQNN